MNKRIGFWKWLITKGKFWLFLWLFCFAGMLYLDVVYGGVVYGDNSIGGILATIVWYAGCFLLLYWLYMDYLEENE